VSEPTIDDKIERLVRSVLEAVDARLLEVRQEVHDLAAHVAARDAEVERHLHDLELRLERSGDSRGAVTGADPLAARMEQATQVLLERIEAMHQRTTIATNERFANVHAAIEELRNGVAAPATTAPLLQGLDDMTAPLRVGPITTQQPVVTAAAPVVAPPVVATPPAPLPVAPAPIVTTAPAAASVPLTAVAPTLAPHNPMPTLEHVPVLPVQPMRPAAPAATAAPVVAPSAPAAPSSPPADDGIDLGRLADLLSERLGHLNLPTRPADSA
jgi:hypothetical protein